VIDAAGGCSAAGLRIDDLGRVGVRFAVIFNNRGIAPGVGFGGQVAIAVGIIAIACDRVLTGIRRIQNLLCG